MSSGIHSYNNQNQQQSCCRQRRRLRQQQTQSPAAAFRSFSVVLSILLVLIVNNENGILLPFLSTAVSAFSTNQQNRKLTPSIFASRSRLSTLSMTSTSSSAVPAAASSATSMVLEGLVKTIVNAADPATTTNNQPIGRGDVATVKYTCYAVDENNDENNVLIARSDSERFVVGDGSMVQGWDDAIRSMYVGERSIVRVTDPNLGYGSGNSGGGDDAVASAMDALDVAVAKSQLEFDIEILNVQTAAAAAEMFQMNVFNDAMALADDTPQTASDIAAAYERRMANKAPEKEGLDYWIDKVQNYYFFGFFEGETGEEAPWYLKPSITFPIAFAIVGAAFYVSLLSGAISEKGQQSIDELDVIVKATSFLFNDVSIN